MKTNFEILAVPYVGEDEATAAKVTDNHSMWLRFIFTDDQPNLNSQGINQQEFENLIKTGALKPFKKVLGANVAADHTDAVPIGAIAELRQKDNQLIALASVWEEEFPEEADFIRQAYAAKTPLNVSWEVFYKDVEVDDKGVNWLKGCSTRAATLVGNPAYGERTPILAVAAVWETKNVNDLPDSCFLYIAPGGKKDKDGKTIPRSLRKLPYKDAQGNVDLPHLRNALARLGQPATDIPAADKARLIKKAQGILAKHQKGGASMDEDTQKELETIRAEKEALEAQIEEQASMHEELETLRKEAEGLRAFKTQVEADKTRAELTKKRLAQFSEAGIEMTEETFVKEADQWLSLNDEAFAFVLKSLVNTKPTKTAGASTTITDEGDSDEISTMKKFLQERKAPKQNDKES